MKQLTIVNIKVTKKGHTVIVLADDAPATFCGITTRVYGAPTASNTSCWLCLQGDHSSKFEALRASTVFEVDSRDISRPDEKSGHRGGFIHPNDITVVTV